MHSLFVAHERLGWKQVVVELSHVCESPPLSKTARHRLDHPVPATKTDPPSSWLDISGHAPTIDGVAFSVRSVFSADCHSPSVAEQKERIRGDICSGTVMHRVDRHARRDSYGLEHNRRGNYRYDSFFKSSSNAADRHFGRLAAIGKAMEHWTDMFQILSISRALRSGKQY